MVLFAVLPAIGQPQTKTLADGVVFVQDINVVPASALIVNVVRVDLSKPGVKVAAALGGDKVEDGGPNKGRETISRLVGRRGALAGVNADFFPWTGDPLGLHISGSELVSEPNNRVAMGITASGEVLIDRLSYDGVCRSEGGLTHPIAGINRARGKNEIVLFTPVYGSNTGNKDGVEVALSLDGPVKANADVLATVTADPAAASSMAIPNGGAVISASGTGGAWLTSNLHKGDKITLRMNIKPMSGGKSWEDVVEAVGGGPWLVHGGQVFVDSAEEQFKPDIVIGRHPRTAAGVTAKGELLMVTVDGRQSISRGATLTEMAQLMKKLGAVNAINLDGGGSTTLSIEGIVINSPSGGSERPVADALLVFAPITANTVPALKFADCGPISLTSSDNRMLSLIDATTNQPVDAQTLQSVVWGTTGGIGFVNQKGYFTPFKAGMGKIVALEGDKRIELPVTVLPSAPAKIVAKTEADPSGAPNLAVLKVSVVDAKDNGVPGIPVTVTVTGGVPDVGQVTTDKDGTANFKLTLDTTLSAAKITVSAAGMSVDVK